MSQLPVLVSAPAVGGGGMTGVSVLVAVWPLMSVTLYVTTVCGPVAAGSATNVATPVVWSMAHTPSPAMVKLALHWLSAGSTRHGP